MAQCDTAIVIGIIRVDRTARGLSPPCYSW